MDILQQIIATKHRELAAGSGCGCTTAAPTAGPIPSLRAALLAGKVCLS